MKCKLCGQHIRSYQDLKHRCPKRPKARDYTGWHVLNMGDIARLPDRAAITKAEEALNG